MRQARSASFVPVPRGPPPNRIHPRHAHEQQDDSWLLECFVMPKLLIKVSSDGLAVFASTSAEAPREGNITPEEMMEALKRNDVLYGIDEDALRAFVKSVQEADATVPSTPITLGTPPAKGMAPEAEIIFAEDKLVRRREILALLQGGEPSCAGRTVRDEEIPAPQQPEPPLLAGENIVYRNNDRSFRSLLSGYVVTEDRRIHVDPLVRVSDDRTTASVRMYPLKKNGPTTTRRDLRQTLQDAGVVHGFLEDDLEGLVMSLKSANGPTDWLIVAQGTVAIRGRDARFQFVADVGTRPGLELEGGRMDYRGRRQTPAVSAGDVIVVKHPATEGSPGKTVTGERGCAPGRRGSPDGIRRKRECFGGRFELLRCHRQDHP